MPAPDNPTAGLTVQQADALWDAVAIPGPHTPTYPEQHDRVCRAVAGILAELPAGRAAVLRKAADGFDRHAEKILDGIDSKAVFVAKALRDQAAVWSEAAETLRRLADEAQPANLYAQSGIDTPGCDCGHPGMGLRGHGETCAWVAGLLAEARELLAKDEPADEAQQEPDYTESVIYEVVGDWGVDSADSEADARAAVAKWLKAYPTSGAYAQQRLYREWPDGSEWYGPWTILPDAPAAASQPSKEA